MHVKSPERPALRAAIAEVGLAKAATLVPAIERTGTWQMWVDLSRQLSAPVLQERVSALASEKKVRAWAVTQAPRRRDEAGRVVVPAGVTVNFPDRRDE